MNVVGIDAGGSRTRAAYARDGVEVRRSEAGAANPTTAGLDAAAETMAVLVRAVTAGEAVDAIAVGAAGAGRPPVARALEARLAAVFPAARVAVVDDARIVLLTAAPGPGIALVAGTGSLAYAEHGERTAYVGGLGYMAGDEGSAFAIGLAAVRLYGRALDGRRRPDETTAFVARALDAPDRAALLAALYDRPPDPAGLAALAPAIIAFASKGNRAANQIVQQAAGRSRANSSAQPPPGSASPILRRPSC